MNTRQHWMFGMAALGLALAAPVQAAPHDREGTFFVARQDAREDIRDDRRDARKDKRRDAKRETERDEPDGYGYGYERRQRQQIEEDGRPRGRR